MINNIKNIIREEIDDLDWIKDVSNKKHVYGVVLLNKDYELIHINANDIDELWSLYREEYGIGLDPMLYSIDNHVLKGFGGIEPKTNIARKMYESDDDGLDWIRDTNINPLIEDGYVVIWFDRKPKKSELDTIRGWYLAIGGGDIYVTNVTQGEYIRFENPEYEDVDYGYGDDQETFYDCVTNTDEYVHYTLSQLFPKNINESQEYDDFDWIRDITPQGYEPKMGDFISVVNTGSETSFLEWLGGHLDNYKSGEYGQNITGTVVERPRGFGDNVYDFFFLKELYTNRVITFPKFHHLEYMSKERRYEGLNLSYVPVSKHTINESEEDDLDWIRNTQLGVPQNLEELKHFIGWWFVYDISRGWSLGDWYADGRKWLIQKIKHGTVYYKDTVTGEKNTQEYSFFLNQLGKGCWVLVSPDGVLLDPHGRVYPKE